MSPKYETSVFDIDAARHGGYLYTKDAPLSAQLATQRTTDIILQSTNFAGCSVLDLGCGDGFYTIRFFDHGSPRMITGVDKSRNALEVAKMNVQNRFLQFVVSDATKLPFPDDTFDIALIQSILHHSDNPLEIIREGFRVAPRVLIHEPNGNNMGLKIIERLSSYHREHRERSYTSRLLKNWMREAGGEVTYEKFAGFVPMFCPGWMASMMKTIEPAIEGLSFFNAVACAVYVVAGRRVV